MQSWCRANENLTVATSAKRERQRQRREGEYLANSKLVSGPNVYADWQLRGHEKCHLPMDLMVALGPRPCGSDLWKWLV